MPEELKAVLMPEEKRTVLTTSRITAAARKRAVEEILQRAEILTADDWEQIAERIFIFGKPAPDYLKYRERVQQFIEKNKILPLERLKPIPGRWDHGGKFVEFKHVHLNNKTYLLDDKQIAALDKDLVKEFQFSLKAAGEIKF